MSQEQASMADIVFILDESGSMGSMGCEPVQAMNQFIRDQQKTGGKSHFTLYTFNNKCRKIYDNKPLEDIKEYKDYDPEGCTALYDCIGIAISEKMETNRKENVVFVIITDGQDNSSKKYSCSQIKELIATQETKYNWQVVYLAANQDAFAVGSAMGLSALRTGNIQNEKHGLLRAVRNISAPISQYRESSAAPDKSRGGNTKPSPLDLSNMDR